jgi:hypothetical protein
VLTADAAEYQCMITSPFDTIFTSPAVINVLPSVIPEIFIAVSDTNICEGTDVVFSAEWMNSGTAPIIIWYRGNTLVATNVASINLDNLEQGEEVYAALISNAPCTQLDTITSEVISVTVNSIIEANLELIGPDRPICEGSTITFSLDYANAGSQPFIQWYLNGLPVSEDENTFEPSDLQNDDFVYATLTSGALCASNTIYFSDTITIIIHPQIEGSLEIIGPDSIVCLGDNILFEASYTNGGDDPNFEWTINDTAVPNNTFQTFETSGLGVGDSVTLIMLSSELCVTNPLLSDTFFPLIDSCTTVSSSDFLNYKHAHLFPNPSSDQFQIHLDGWEGQCQWQIADFAGRIIRQSNFTPDSYNYSLTLTIAESGIYVVTIKNSIYYSVFSLLIL